MKNLLLLSTIAAISVFVAAAQQQSSSAGAGQMKHATGSFEIQMKPQGGGTDGKTFPRFTSEKQFQGDLEGTSVGEMLASGPPPSGQKGSGAYVAMERVTAKLGGRSGSFILQHSSSMNQGVQQQDITVVPQSGTGELAGLEGKMIIRIEGGKHYYDFDYSISSRQ
jgi:Protein of unknown function (DUF3224)